MSSTVDRRSGRIGRRSFLERGTLGMLATVAAVLTAGCGGSSSPSSARPSAASSSSGAYVSEEARKLVSAAASKGETTLTLSWSGNTLGGVEGYRKFEAVFNSMYGTNMKIDFTPGPSMTDMMAKVSQEVAAGRATSTDVLIGTDSHYVPILDRGVLEGYDYATLSPWIRPDMVAPNQIGVEIYGTTAGVLYNPGLVPESAVPHKLADTLDPRWKGKIASSPDAAYLDIVTLRPEWGPEKMKAFVTSLTDQVAGLLRVGEETRIVSGEFAMLVMGNTHSVTDLKGAQIKVVIPTDAGVTRFVYLGVPRTAAHPNLAKLFINMILSADGQRILYDVYSTDHYELPGSRSAEDLKAQGIDKSQMLAVNIQLVAQHPELKQVNQDLSRILREKGGK